MVAYLEEIPKRETHPTLRSKVLKPKPLFFRRLLSLSFHKVGRFGSTLVLTVESLAGTVGGGSERSRSSRPEEFVHGHSCLNYGADRSVFRSFLTHLRSTTEFYLFFCFSLETEVSLKVSNS